MKGLEKVVCFQETIHSGKILYDFKNTFIYSLFEIGLKVFELQEYWWRLLSEWYWNYKNASIVDRITN